MLIATTRLMPEVSGMGLPAPVPPAREKALPATRGAGSGMSSKSQESQTGPSQHWGYGIGCRPLHT